MRLFAAAVSFAATLTACPPPPVPPSPETGDAWQPPDAGDGCDRAQANLIALGCLDPRGRLIGGRNLHGAWWADVCRQDQEAGVSLKPSCIAVSQDCSAVEACR